MSKDCCSAPSAKASDASPCCCEQPPTVTAEWTRSDRLGAIKCRVSNRFRMNYRVTPGLHKLGSPGPDSLVFVSANYKLSFDVLRRGLAGLDAWILVLDTKGINVWCAAGKGTFGTAELVRRITESRLAETVTHRRVIVPQLGAPNVSAARVRKETGFAVSFGPVEARDIRAYVQAGLKATPAMRVKQFPVRERLELTPMEVVPSARKLALVIAVLFVVFGLGAQGILFDDALPGTIAATIAGLAAVLAGAFVTPMALPWIPFRSFALKGVLASLAVVGAILGSIPVARTLPPALLAASVLFAVTVGSYIAVNFTGCTTFTSISGVKKELRIAVPAYLVGLGVSAVLVVVYKLQQWGVL
jgi:acetyl-CoA decarbonylase/synthase complex subunit gamma